MKRKFIEKVSICLTAAVLAGGLAACSSDGNNAQDFEESLDESAAESIAQSLEESNSLGNESMTESDIGTGTGTEPAGSSDDISENRLPAVNVGDVITFGSYEQDNDTSTPGSAEDIEWIVIAEEGNQALLLSRYIIDCIPFDSENTSASWEDSYMRQWLNETFYESAFDDTEKSAIIATELETQIPGYSNTVSTTDNVFLLSGADLGRYFEFDYWDETYHLGECAPALVTSATEYALANGCYNTELNSRSAAETVAAHPELNGQMSEMWWVRETGSIVGLNGDTIGNSNWQPGDALIPISRRANAAMGVRPAIWIAVED